jgi:hypothetical protein
MYSITMSTISCVLDGITPIHFTTTQWDGLCQIQINSHQLKNHATAQADTQDYLLLPKWASQHHWLPCSHYVVCSKVRSLVIKDILCSCWFLNMAHHVGVGSGIFIRTPIFSSVINPAWLRTQRKVAHKAHLWQITEGINLTVPISLIMLISPKFYHRYFLNNTLDLCQTWVIIELYSYTSFNYRCNSYVVMTESYLCWIQLRMARRKYRL